LWRSKQEAKLSRITDRTASQQTSN